MTQLLAQGWGFEKVKERHVRHAARLLEQGVQWEVMEGHDRPVVERLVRANILGIPTSWTIDPAGGGVVARDSDGKVIGAVVAGAARFDDGQVVTFVRHLVVDPAWRGKGVGVVTLGVLHQLFSAEDQPVVFVGNCAPQDAKFYQRSGYTVLQPGEQLILPVGTPIAIGLSSQPYPCWFFRTR